ncbi:MAG: NAD(P)/FAD-dependent oxidoreductase [Arenicellales bacterium]
MTHKSPLVIIGAGPAGLAAADVAGRLGIDTIVLDDQKSAGGQIYRGLSDIGDNLLKVLGPEYKSGRELVSGLEHASVTWKPQATVWQITEDGTVYYSDPTGSSYLQSEQVILATGALERPMPFPGWTLPGVMTAGGIQIALKTAGLTPEGEFVLVGSGPLLLLLTRQVLNAGGKITALIETTPRQNSFRALKYFPGMLKSRELLRSGIQLMGVIRKHGIPHYRHASSLTAVGKEKVEGLQFRSGGRMHELGCSVLGIHIGVVPNIQISRHLNLSHDWQPVQHCWYPRTGPCGETELSWLRIAGDGRGIFGAKAAELQGTLAAWSAIVSLDKTDQSGAKEMIQITKEKLLPLSSARPFIDCLYAPSQEFLTPADETIVCRCEEVSAGDIRSYVDLGCTGPNQTKSFGRPGMGPCQGRYCGLVVSELIADQRQVPVSEVGYYRIRPPIKPVTLAELASLHKQGM